MMERRSAIPGRHFYYGWVIVGLSMVSMAFWFGTRTTFSVFFVALIDHFQWGRAEAAGAQSIAMMVYMIMAPIIGTLVDRIGPRKVIVPGILLTGFGFLLCTQIRTLIQYLISSQGWPFAFFIFSLLIFAIPLPLNAIFLKHRPQEMGFLADGDPMTPSDKGGAED